MARSETYENDLHLEATELRLGLPGSKEPENQSNSNNVARSIKRSSPDQLPADSSSTNNSSVSDARNEDCPPPSKAQIVGWPPIRSYRKNTLQTKKSESDASGMFVKVSMDGAPYLRKIDLKMYQSYPELLKAMESMFKICIGQYSERDGYNGSDVAPTYEDKDGDWMLVGDVPWEMFITSCKRLRIMKSSEAKGLGCL
ncbi:auxin-induced protein 22D-like [Chenopodium quinoa]|uniref:auxin-induced protein 22D-like n=1 Tax=Chenopodium quinoa TaxID=63459 RepID=UPI000B77C0D0|nr:auxin-induced protein 22D-like [Chenopodium quinoa]